MEASFKSDAKNVKECSNDVNIALCEFKDKQISTDLSKSAEFQNAAKLIEKLSIVNEYKLNLFKEFSIHNYLKK